MFDGGENIMLKLNIIVFSVFKHCTTHTERLNAIIERPNNQSKKTVVQLQRFTVLSMTHLPRSDTLYSCSDC